jgi:chorismate mutase
MRDLSAELESELTEARDRIDDLTATGIHSCGDDCKRPNCVLRRELAEAMKQRDALADVVLDIRAGYGGQVADPDCPCEDCKFLAKLNSALATLEGRAE